MKKALAIILLLTVLFLSACDSNVTQQISSDVTATQPTDSMMMPENWTGMELNKRVQSGIVSA